MDLIQLLPDSVANQIAAGEVIQRPASVVKELVENAVDAGAHRIDVIAVDAGRTSLQVVDDGCGMSETDARLAFERHATSKIREAADLFTLTTMGFRGEALPSIVAVAQVEMTTRTADSDLGTRLQIEASRVVAQEPVACAVGTNIVVKNLFFNVPARRKFLKTTATELNNITAELERIVLVHPDISFSLAHNDTPILNLSPSSAKGRIAAVFGSRIAERLLPVAVETPMVNIRGFVGKPEAARKRGAQQFFFVNDRYMRHPYFHRAVQEAFTRLIPADEQVPYFIYFDVPPADIDVNIHPTKTEIKFENEQAIWQILLAAVREAIGKFNAIPTIEFDTEGRPADMPVYNPNVATLVEPPTVTLNAGFNPFEVGTDPAYAPRQQGLSEKRPDDAFTPTFNRRTAAPDGWEMLYGQPQVAAPAPTDSRAFFQYQGQYILTATESGLLIVDQHRAHIRVLYDRYVAQLASSGLPSQRYLFPEVMQLTASQSATFSLQHENLSRLGFDINDLGGGNVSIVGYPSGFEGLDPQLLLADILAAAADSGNLDSDQLFGRLASTLAQAAAIPRGQVLSETEMQDLVAQLFASTNANYTPDGHAVTAIIGQETIDKLFKA
ncbi:MAG: DNA mismatch repair endonuclease MutL [Bacteroidaceae bacterium]|nr:DNA mismatch repair endonuclease MutL [Bacteroidaceae bacterium]